MAAILDAFALVALAQEEPAAAGVEIILRRGGSRISAVNLAEAVDQLGRVHGHSPRRLREVFEPLFADIVDVMDVTESSAWSAADVRRAHYRRRISELSLADCFVLAAAQAGDAIVTADPPLARAAETEGLEVVGLPTREGADPSAPRVPSAGRGDVAQFLRFSQRLRAERQLPIASPSRRSTRCDGR